MTERVQKLTEAVYRVTNLFPDKEPLKWQLRENAVEIFDLFLSISKTGQDEQKSILLEDLLRKINHLFQLALFSGAFIANVNFDILKREYLSLAEETGKNQVQPKEIPPPKGLLIIPNIYKGHSNGQSNGHHNGQSNGHNGQPARNASHSDAGGKKDKENKGLSISSDERKKRIISCIKPNEWKTIKDIAVLMPEIGEKSLQRDLLEMVESGVLKKTGDKRWRKYALFANFSQD